MAMMQEQQGVGQELEADMGAAGPMLIQTLEVIERNCGQISWHTSTCKPFPLHFEVIFIVLHRL